MTNSETKNFSQNVSSSYHLRGKCSDECKKDSLNVPKLRFEGYNEEWKKIKPGEHLNICRGASPRPIEKYITMQSNGINWIKIGDISPKENVIKTTKEKITEEGAKHSRYVRKGDLILSNSMSFGRPYILEIDGCIHDGWLLIQDLEKLFDKKYLCYLLDSDTVKHQYRKYAAGGVVINLNSELVRSVSVFIPKVQEQEKIASFLTLIDKKIEKQKELIELLKKYKRGLLSQIFSQKLRFKDKNGNNYPDWEECRFDEIFQILRNNTLSRECLNYTNVGVKNIHYGDILVKYNTCINDEIDKIPNINSDINFNKISDDNYLKVGDVILADTAEDYTVGKACEIVSCKVKILSGLHTIPCRPTQNFAKGYLGYYLNSAEYHDKLIPLITGIKVSAISKKEIKKTIIKYPIYKEQEKIANLLLLIENKLNSNIKKLELFETYKKGLLQQLFI